MKEPCVDPEKVFTVIAQAVPDPIPWHSPIPRLHSWVQEVPIPPECPGKEQEENARHVDAGMTMQVTTSKSTTSYVPNASTLVNAA